MKDGKREASRVGLNRSGSDSISALFRLEPFNYALKCAVGLYKVPMTGVPDALTVCGGLRSLNQIL